MTLTEVRADFPSDATSAGQARRFVDAALRAWSCDALLEVATLLVSELVANAVLHAGTPIRVVVRMGGGRLRVEVHDGSARLPGRKHYSSLSATGRGLLLVERMADEWGVAPTGAGKHVWFELDTTTPRKGAESRTFDYGDIDLDDLQELAEGDRRGGSGGAGQRGGHAGPHASVLVGSGPL